MNDFNKYFVPHIRFYVEFTLIDGSVVVFDNFYTCEFSETVKKYENKIDKIYMEVKK